MFSVEDEGEGKRREGARSACSFSYFFPFLCFVEVDGTSAIDGEGCRSVVGGGNERGLFNDKLML
jgi:hypothetical protein